MSGGIGRTGGAGPVRGVENDDAAAAPAPAQTDAGGGSAVVRGSAPRMTSGGYGAAMMAERLTGQAGVAAAGRPTAEIRAEFQAAAERGDDAALMRAISEVVRPLLDSKGNVPAKPDAAAMKRFLEVADPVEGHYYLSHPSMNALARAVDTAGPASQAVFDKLFEKAPRVPPGPNDMEVMGDDQTMPMHETRWSHSVVSHLQSLVREDMKAANPADRLKTIDRLLAPHLRPDPDKPGEFPLKPKTDKDLLGRAIASFSYVEDEFQGMEKFAETVRAAGPEAEARITAAVNGQGYGMAHEWFNTLGGIDSAKLAADPKIAAALTAMKPLMKNPNYNTADLKKNPAPADVAAFRQALAALPPERLKDLAFAGDPHFDTQDETDLGRLDAAIRSVGSADQKKQWEAGVAEHYAGRMESALRQGITVPPNKFIDRLLWDATTDNGNVFDGPKMALKPDANPADVARVNTVLSTLHKRGLLPDLARSLKESGSSSTPSGGKTEYTGLKELSQSIALPGVATEAVRRAWRDAVRGLGL